MSETASRRGWVITAAALVVGLAVGAAVVYLVSRDDGSAEHTLRGKITLTSTPSGYNEETNFYFPGESCLENGSDVYFGQVVVRNASGRLVGVGQIDITHDECELTFSLAVKDSDFYTVKIGRREPITLSASEMEALHWRLDG